MNGRDAKVVMIDLWMETPAPVAEVWFSVWNAKEKESAIAMAA